jgi:hypothetical protein
MLAVLSFPAERKLPLQKLQMWNVLLQDNFRFFHPDDFLLIGKNDGAGFVQITLSYVSPDAISWRLKMKNVDLDMMSSFAKVSTAVAEPVLIADEFFDC